MLGVIMLGVIMLGVVMLGVLMLKVAMLGVVMMSDVVPFKITFNSPFWENNIYFLVIEHVFIKKTAHGKVKNV